MASIELIEIAHMHRSRYVPVGPVVRLGGPGVMATRLAVGMAAVVLLAGCTVNGTDSENRVAELENEVAVAAVRIAQLERRVEDLQRELDETRSEASPSQESAGSDGRAEPPTELDYADDVPRVTRRTVVFVGSDGPTRAQSLDGGDFAVHVATFGDCVPSLSLQSIDGERRSLPVVQRDDTAEVVLDGLPAGDWYVDGVGGQACAWTVTLTPR